MAEAGRVSINESVGEALRVIRENWRFVLIAAALSALAATLISTVGAGSPPLSLLGSLISTFIQAFVYATFISIALSARKSLSATSLSEAWRVWSAMVVVGFFLFIVFFVLLIPGAIVLVVGPMASYVPDLQAAGQDQTRVASVFMRFAQEQPLAILLFLLFYGALWLALTSRLYLAAPASLDQGRVLTFETWKWTRNNMLRIMGARLMLLIPAYILATALAFFAGAAIGVDASNPGAVASLEGANIVLFLVYATIANFVSTALYSSLEAGLSAALYRRLKQSAPHP